MDLEIMPSESSGFTESWGLQGGWTLYPKDLYTHEALASFGESLKRLLCDGPEFTCKLMGSVGLTEPGGFEAH